MNKVSCLKRFVLVWLTACSASVAWGVGTVAYAERPMNVLFLVIDDLNTWLLSTPGRYTGRVAAPSIRRLAESGVNFTRAYNAKSKLQPSGLAGNTGAST